MECIRTFTRMRAARAGGGRGSEGNVFVFREFCNKCGVADASLLRSFRALTPQYVEELPPIPTTNKGAPPPPPPPPTSSSSSTKSKKSPKGQKKVAAAAAAAGVAAAAQKKVAVPPPSLASSPPDAARSSPPGSKKPPPSRQAPSLSDGCGTTLALFHSHLTCSPSPQRITWTTV